MLIFIRAYIITHISYIVNKIFKFTKVFLWKIPLYFPPETTLSAIYSSYFPFFYIVFLCLYTFWQTDFDIFLLLFLFSDTQKDDKLPVLPVLFPFICCRFHDVSHEITFQTAWRYMIYSIYWYKTFNVICLSLADFFQHNFRPRTLSSESMTVQNQYNGGFTHEFSYC